MPCILAVASALPEHYYSQDELGAALLAMNPDGGRTFDRDKVRRFFSSVAVGGRHLALPLERYARLSGLGERNAAWLEVAQTLGQKAVSAVLEQSGLAAGEIQLFMSSTVTGIAVPSLEVRLMNRLNFATDCRRLPLFGLGCMAGAAGIARLGDYLLAHPDHAALLLCTELCSLTFQREDLSVTNIIASGLFGDGAACVLMAGDKHPLASRGPRVVDTRSLTFPDTERVMGWDVVDNGFRIVLSSGVPQIAKTGLSAAIRRFLHDHELTAQRIARWVAHPGGPAVISALEQSLELAPGALDLSRDCLARLGNLSSASVLVILQRTLADPAPEPGSFGLLLAMGPGFGAELVLLQW